MSQSTRPGLSCELLREAANALTSGVFAPEPASQVMAVDAAEFERCLAERMLIAGMPPLAFASESSDVGAVS